MSNVTFASKNEDRACQLAVALRKKANAEKKQRVETPEERWDAMNDDQRAVAQAWREQANG